MESLDWQGWFTIAVVAGMLVAMVRGIGGPDLILMAGLFCLPLAGILTVEETFIGFSNPALATVGALFILSAAMRETGALELVLGRLFGRARSERAGLARTLPVLGGLSAFLNNAPVVAMMTPLMIEWARRNRFAPSRLLIPLSYSTILGSIITVIGTSVTLTVVGLVVQSGLPPLAIFALAPVGLPIFGMGLLYLLFVAPRILPTRQDPATQVGEHTREYTVAMIVEESCVLIGQDIEEAGLRGLPGLFLFELERGGEVISPVTPEQVIAAGDRLVFAGVVSTIVDLQRIRGLVPADEADSPVRGTPNQQLIEAVISRSSPLVNRTIRQVGFRTVYEAAVIAVHRDGHRVPGKIGRIMLRPGDTLVFLASPSFVERHRNSPDFYLVSEVPESQVPRHERAWLAIAVFVAMVALAAAELLPISIGSFLAGGILIATRCISGPAARKSVQLHVLVVIAAGLGVAYALDKTGAAAAMAGPLVWPAQALGPIGVLAVVYLVTMLAAELLHHNAAAALMFPIAVAAANQIGADPMGFVMAVALAANCAFASPATYQTHLLVYGPGGYELGDFIKVGLPLDVICAVVSIALIPLVWPL